VQRYVQSSWSRLNDVMTTAKFEPRFVRRQTRFGDLIEEWNVGFCISETKVEDRLSRSY
jgi:hypothetical protein